MHTLPTPELLHALQRDMEASFRRQGWNYRTALYPAHTVTDTLINGEFGRRTVEVSLAHIRQRIKIRIGTGLFCPPERRLEVAGFLADFNFCLDASEMGIAPSGQLVVRGRVLDARPGRTLRRVLVNAIKDAELTVWVFHPGIRELIAGRMTGAEIFEAIRGPGQG